MTQQQFRNLLYFIVFLGAINWGLIGTFNFNMLHYLLFGNTIAKKIVYTLVGIAGLYLMFTQNSH